MQRGHLSISGVGRFTKLCGSWLETNLPCQRALLTHSCTAFSIRNWRLFLIDIKPGDEIIMPSYTFVSSANASVLRGVPVVDKRRYTKILMKPSLKKLLLQKLKQFYQSIMQEWRVKWIPY